jgi:hypothetical protein
MPRLGWPPAVSFAREKPLRIDIIIIIIIIITEAGESEDGGRSGDTRQPLGLRRQQQQPAPILRRLVRILVLSSILGSANGRASAGGK